jgi:predicted nucleic acid-binding protein
MTATITIAYDTNTLRSGEFIPFLISFQEIIRIVIPTIVYVEMGYYFLLQGQSITDYDEELNTYNAEVLLLTKDHLQNAINLAYAHRTSLPFKDHSRDYLIAGQCMGLIDVLVTYNVKHFKDMKIDPIRIMTPEEFIFAFIPE